jgi:hypothetical protein
MLRFLVVVRSVPVLMLKALLVPVISLVTVPERALTRWIYKSIKASISGADTKLFLPNLEAWFLVLLRAGDPWISRCQSQL